MADCLKAGKPFLTCPVLYPLGDQFFWGSIAYQKGVSLKPIPWKKMTEEGFMSNINELISNNDLYISATQLAEQLSSENGIESAIEIIEKNYTYSTLETE